MLPVGQQWRNVATMSSGTRAGDLLRRAREERHESLRQAAASLTVAPSHLSRLERGEKGASEELLRRAARYYGLKPSELGASDIPDDIRRILRERPELVNEIRERYGDANGG